MEHTSSSKTFQLVYHFAKFRTPGQNAELGM